MALRHHTTPFQELRGSQSVRAELPNPQRQKEKNTCLSFSPQLEKPNRIPCRHQHPIAMSGSELTSSSGEFMGSRQGSAILPTVLTQPSLPPSSPQDPASQALPPENPPSCLWGAPRSHSLLRPPLSLTHRSTSDPGLPRWAQVR